MRLWVAALLIGLVVQPAVATTYQTPSDFGVTCLDLATGAVVWHTPGTLLPPEIRVVDDVVVASENPQIAGKAIKTMVMSAGDGKVLKRRAPAGGTKALAALPQQLVDDHRRTLGYQYGGTDALATAETTFLALDWYVDDLAVWGHLALFSFAQPVRSGGELYAWDLDAGKLAWVFHAADHVKDLPSTAPTYFRVDGDRVLVSSDEHLFAIDAATGAMVWKTDLPRQTIRVYDSPWTTFARHGDLVIARVYEQLFAVRATDGALAWSFASGQLSTPWPTIAGNRVFIASRTGGIQMTSTSITRHITHPPSAVVVTRDRAGTVKLEVRDRRDLPAGTTLWGTLNRPPLPPVRSRPIRSILELSAQRAISLDLTTVLSRPGTVWVQFDSLGGTATVKVADKTVATLEIPDSL